MTEKELLIKKEKAMEFINKFPNCCRKAIVEFVNEIIQPEIDELKNLMDKVM